MALLLGGGLDAGRLVASASVAEAGSGEASALQAALRTRLAAGDAREVHAALRKLGAIAARPRGRWVPWSASKPYAEVASAARALCGALAVVGEDGGWPAARLGALAGATEQRMRRRPPAAVGAACMGTAEALKPEAAPAALAFAAGLLRAAGVDGDDGGLSAAASAACARLGASGGPLAGCATSLLPSRVLRLLDAVSAGTLRACVLSAAGDREHSRGPFATLLGVAFGTLASSSLDEGTALCELQELCASMEPSSPAATPPVAAFALTVLPSLVGQSGGRAALALDVLSLLRARGAGSPRGMVAVLVGLAAGDADATARLATLAAASVDAAALRGEGLAARRARFALPVAAAALQRVRASDAPADAWPTLAAAAARAASRPPLAAAGLAAGSALLRTQSADAAPRGHLALNLLAAGLTGALDHSAGRRVAPVVDAALSSGLPPDTARAFVRTLGARVVSDGGGVATALLLRCVTGCELPLLPVVLEEAKVSLKRLPDGRMQEAAGLARVATLAADAVRKGEVVQWLLETVGEANGRRAKL